jgi:hypothetical protein
VQVGVGGQEVGNPAIADAQEMLQLGGHGEDHWAEGIAGRPRASEVCSGCRPCQRWRQQGQKLVSMLNWVTMGTMGGRSV